MHPRSDSQKSGKAEMFRHRLVDVIDETDEIVKLAHLVDWNMFDCQYDSQYHPNYGAAGLPTRRMVALQYIKYMFDLSDEKVIARWIENPCWQYFSGETHLQSRKPCDSSQLSRWRKRIGEEKLKLTIQETIRIAKEQKIISDKNMSKVVVDTTVQEKNVTCPTAAKLHYRAILRLVAMCKILGILLRQSYTRRAKVRYLEARRFASCHKNNELRKANQDLKNWLGRILRDIERKGAGIAFSEEDQKLIAIANKLYVQNQDTPDKDRVYSIHEPSVCAIAKDKERVRYEYGNQVSVLKTNDRNFILNVEHCPDNSSNGHTLAKTISNGEKMTGVPIREVAADTHYAKSDYKGKAKILIHETSNAGLCGCEKRRNFLHGVTGDILNAIGVAAGFNMKEILRKL
jgi:IS5 family transposase